jgi:hypothetical protein
VRPVFVRPIIIAMFIVAPLPAVVMKTLVLAETTYMFLAFPPHLSYQMMCPVGCCWHLPTFRTRTTKVPFATTPHCCFISCFIRYSLRFLYIYMGLLPSRCVHVLHWLTSIVRPMSCSIYICAYICSFLLQILGAGDPFPYLMIHACLWLCSEWIRRLYYYSCGG